MLNKKEESNFISWLTSSDPEYSYLARRIEAEVEGASVQNSELLAVVDKWLKIAYEKGIRQSSDT